MGGLRLVVVAAGVAGASVAFADGFEIESHSTKSLGTSNAGRSASAEDAATVWWNPAGMTRLGNRPLFTMSLTRVDLDETFHDEGTIGVTGAPTSGDRAENGAAPAHVPAMYATYPVNDDLFVGLGVTAPFGLGTNYGEKWKGRYFATNSEALLMVVNPAVALKLTDQWSVGAGVSAQHAQANIANMIDTGAIGAGAGIPGLAPGRNDTLIEVDGTDWAWGYNLGALWEPCPGTRFGAAYRSHFDHRLRGDADFRVPAAALPLTGAGAFTDTKAESAISTPSSLSVSAYHEFDPKWAFVGDVTFMGWNRVDELTVDFDNPAQPGIVQKTDWKNTFRYAVGAIHKFDADWTFRAGVALTDTPVPNSTRDARIPDEDRMWLSVGASRRLSDSVSLDFAFVYIRVIHNAVIDTTNPLAGRLQGDVHWRPIYTVSAGLTVAF